MKTKYLIYVTYVILLAFIILTVYFSLSNARDKTNSKQHLQIIRNLAKLRFESKIDSSFDQIPKYYINLDRSKDRNIVMKEEIAKYNVKNIERFPAVDGKLLKSVNKGEINGYTYQVNVKENYERNELGCTLSHLLLISKIYDLNLDHALILEDDMHFSFSPYWEKSIGVLISEIPKDWDLLYLGHSGKINFSKSLKINKIDYNIPGAFSYLISRKGCKKIIDLFFEDKNSILIKDEGINIDTYLLTNLDRYTISNNYFSNCNPLIDSTIREGYTDISLDQLLKLTNYYLKKKEQQNEV